MITHLIVGIRGSGVVLLALVLSRVLVVVLAAYKSEGKGGGSVTTCGSLQPFDPLYM